MLRSSRCQYHGAFRRTLGCWPRWNIALYDICIPYSVILFSHTHFGAINHSCSVPGGSPSVKHDDAKANVIAELWPMPLYLSSLTQAKDLSIPRYVVAMWNLFERCTADLFSLTGRSNQTFCPFMALKACPGWSCQSCWTDQTPGIVYGIDIEWPKLWFRVSLQPNVRLPEEWLWERWP